jgi:hypothetical protein
MTPAGGMSPTAISGQVEMFGELADIEAERAQAIHN